VLTGHGCCGIWKSIILNFSEGCLSFQFEVVVQPHLSEIENDNSIVYTICTRQMAYTTSFSGKKIKKLKKYNEAI